MEKTYYFTISRGVDNQQSIAVNESDLTAPQKSLLLGEAYKLYEDLPPDMQILFKERFRLIDKPICEDDDLLF